MGNIHFEGYGYKNAVFHDINIAGVFFRSYNFMHIFHQYQCSWDIAETYYARIIKMRKSSQFWSINNCEGFGELMRTFLSYQNLNLFFYLKHQENDIHILLQTTFFNTESKEL